LFNEGEKEKDKNIKILESNFTTVLAESEITSNFQERGIKSPSEIICKEGSILLIQNIYESIWTMDKQHITCYSEHGIKVFSKNMKDSHHHQESMLSTTLLKVLEVKFPRNPECNIVYDPYNHLFYTFGWPQDGHYFPTAVLVSHDKKYSLQPKGKKIEIETKGLTSLAEIKKFALHHMSQLDKTSIKAKYRFNDWLWTYGQKIVEIGNELNSTEDKKRLSNKRTKIMAKMNKLNDLEKHYERNKAEFSKRSKVVKEIVKIYPFDSEGTYHSYKLIHEAFEDLPEHPEEVYLYITCLQNWLENCSVISDPEVKTALLELGENLMLLKKKSTSVNRDIISKLLIEEFYLFFPTLEKQIIFINSMCSEELEQFVRFQWRNQKKEKESIVYELTKKELLVQKYETNKCDFA
jgi:hypothetical protein